MAPANPPLRYPVDVGDRRWFLVPFVVVLLAAAAVYALSRTTHPSDYSAF